MNHAIEEGIMKLTKGKEKVMAKKVPAKKPAAKPVKKAPAKKAMK